MIKKDIEYIGDDINMNVEIIKVYEGESHWHESIEIIYVMDGYIEVNKVDHTYLMEKGDLYIINTRDIHQLVNTGEDNLILLGNIPERYVKKTHGELYGEIFSCKCIKNLIDKDYFCTNEYFDKKQSVIDEIKEKLLRIFIINKMLKEAMKNLESRKLIQKYKSRSLYYSNELINLINKEFTIDNYYKNSENYDGVTRERNYKFMQYVHRNYNKKITLEDLSRELNLNKFYISRVLNKYVPTGLAGYINGIRIYNGKDLLILTNKSVSEIAEEIGYSSATTFIKYFKKHFDITPAEFRKKYKTNNMRSSFIEVSGRKLNNLLEENIDDYLDFVESVQDGTKIKLFLAKLEKQKIIRKLPKINYILQSEKPFEDLEKINSKDSLFALEYKKWRLSNNKNEIVNRTIEEKLKDLVKDISIGRDIEEEFKMKDLIKNHIETPQYYFYAFLRLLNENILDYKENYIISKSNLEEYTILVLLKKKYKEEEEISIEIDLEDRDEPIRIISHRLGSENIGDIEIRNKNEVEILKSMVMPKSRIDIIKKDKYSLKGKDGELILVKINR